MKIHKVDRHLGITIAGGVADAQNLVDVMRYNANIYRISNKELIPIMSALDSILIYYLISNTFLTMCRLLLQDMIIKEADRSTILTCLVQ